jgi:hypothetical protein
VVCKSQLEALHESVRIFEKDEIFPVDRLAAAIFVNSSSPAGSRLMAMFSAYFDASGTPEESYVVVSGYIANFFQWTLIESSWRSTHDAYGVSTPFHASDLMAAISNPGYKNQSSARKDYVQLASDPPKAKDFLRDISTLELTMVNCAVTTIVPMDVYKGVSELLDLRQVIPPYALAARTCIDLVRHWEKTFNVGEPVECIFEEGDFEQGKFTSLMVDEGMPLPIYKKKIDYAGLQAADHHAWERAFFMKKPGDAASRTWLRLLVGSIPKLHIQTTTATLIGLCHLKNIDPLTGIKRDK